MITVEHLTKYYGDLMAVDDLSFEIEGGHVYGFLGPNGAGKSTTMNIMTGCLSATEGRVRIEGYDIFEDAGKAKKLIGYLPEQPPLYMNETPVEYLKFVGEAKGLKGEELRRQIEEVIDQTKIDGVRDRLISKLSKGYKQRVGIAQALLGNPKVIILDEPTVGLDPLQIIEIRDLIKQLGQRHTVILSSHILSEVQAICEKVLIIDKGKLVAFDNPENLEKLLQTSNEIVLTAEATAEEVEEILKEVGHISEHTLEEADKGLVTAHIKIDDAQRGLHGPGDGKTEFAQVASRDICRKLFFAFASKNRALLELTSKKANLEDVFIQLTESGGNGKKEDVESRQRENGESGENSKSDESEVSDR